MQYLAALAGAALLAGGAVAFWFYISHSSETEGTAAQAQAPLVAAQTEATALATTERGGWKDDGLTQPETRAAALMPGAAATPVKAGPSHVPPVEPAETVAQLEARYRATPRAEDRIELAGQIAGNNDAAAVQSLARLFQTEKHSQVKLALVASLAEISHDEAPAERLRLLAAALQNQPRDVREAALESLANLDDAGAAPLIRDRMLHDPDREIRDSARALYEALVPEGTPRTR